MLLLKYIGYLCISSVCCESQRIIEDQFQAVSKNCAIPLAFHQAEQMKRLQYVHIAGFALAGMRLYLKLRAKPVEVEKHVNVACACVLPVHRPDKLSMWLPVVLISCPSCSVRLCLYLMSVLEPMSVSVRVRPGHPSAAAQARVCVCVRMCPRVHGHGCMRIDATKEGQQTHPTQLPLGETCYDLQ